VDGPALDDIKANQKRLDLNAGAGRVSFARHCAGLIAREADTTEVKRQLEAHVLEPTSSEWVFPVPLVRGPAMGILPLSTLVSMSTRPP